jgi:hypothetical protein
MDGMDEVDRDGHGQTQTPICPPAHIGLLGASEPNRIKALVEAVLGTNPAFLGGRLAGRYGPVHCLAMPVTNTPSQSGNDALNPLRASLAEKFESLGEFQKKAFEHPLLFLALAVVYSFYLKSSLCPTGPRAVIIDLNLLLPVLKFLLITGWPCAVLASLDTTWEGKHSAFVSLSAYTVANAFWLHKYGVGFCPYSYIFGLVGYTFSAGIGHGIGWALRSVPLPAKIIIIAGSLFAFTAAQAFNYAWAHKSPTPRIVTTAAMPSAPTADYSATAQKAAETPHFWQLDPRGEFLNGGRDYCGPVAVSDSLVYLGRHGFPELLPASRGEQAQIDMINLLASPHYLGTDPNMGTGIGSVLRGIEKYVVSRGYQCSTMEYEGWSRMDQHEEEFVMADKPDLNWMRKGVLDPHGVVWLAVGWYNQTGNGQWKRTGGHWVPLVGFDAKNPNALLIHNPGTRGNGSQPDDPAQDVIHLRPVGAGTLVTGEGPDLDASGRYQIAGPGLPMNPGQVAFLDAAIVVVISKL